MLFWRCGKRVWQATHFIVNDKAGQEAGKEKELERTCEAYEKLYQQCEKIAEQRDNFYGHLVLARSLIDEEQARKAAIRKDKRQRRGVRAQAQLLTGAEALAQAAAEEEAARKEQEKKDQKCAEKEAEFEERLTQQGAEGDSFAFKVPLSRCKKIDLRHLARDIGVDDGGKNSEISQRIQEHFSSNPLLKEQPKYTGLFPSGNRRRAAQTNSAPPANEPEPPGMHPPTLPTPPTHLQQPSCILDEAKSANRPGQVLMAHPNLYYTNFFNNAYYTTPQFNNPYIDNTV